VIRLLLFLLTRRWGLMVLGLLLAFGGLVFGANSHQIAYQTLHQGGRFRFIAVEGGTDYILLNATYYVINENNVSPAFDGPAFGRNNNLTLSSITYRTDSSSIDVKLTDGTELQGTAYTAEQFVVIDTSGSNHQTYTTAEFTQNPNGFYENDWLGGMGLLVGGLTIAGLAYFIPRLRGKNKTQRGWSTAPAGLPMGIQPQVHPYQQPYQGPVSYPQYQPQSYQTPSHNWQPPYPVQSGQSNPVQWTPPSHQPAQYSHYPQQPGQHDRQQSGSYEPSRPANPYDTRMANT
jgi:hypothetical protein